MESFSFCHQCGQPYSQLTWPRVCSHCQSIHYRGSSSVAVALVPILQDTGETLLMGVQRNIEPQKGKWALPGGFVDYNETIEEAVAREVFEETHLKIQPNQFRIHNSIKTPDGKVLIFCVGPIIHQHVLEKECLGQELDHETMAIGTLRPGQNLAFPIHTQMMNDFFEHLGGFKPYIFDLDEPHSHQKSPPPLKPSF